MSCAKVSALGYILLMPKSVLLPLNFILWQRLKEREMKWKTLFSISVISFKLESNNILLKIEEFVNGGNKSPDYSFVFSSLTCFVTFSSCFKSPLLHLLACKMGNPSQRICKGLLINFKISVRRICVCPAIKGKGNVIRHFRA